MNDVSTSIRDRIYQFKKTRDGVYSWKPSPYLLTARWLYLDSSSDGGTAIFTRGTSGVLPSERGPFISIDGGLSWAQRVIGMSFDASDIYTIDTAIASGNRDIMYAANRGSTSYAPLWRSTNRGVSWSSSISPAAARWQAIDCSSDGQVIVATNVGSTNASFSQRIVYSTNGGSSWNIVPDFTAQWQFNGVAVSASGSSMFVIVIGSTAAPIRRSINTGSTWSEVTGSFRFYSIACSDDGQTVIAGRGVGSGTTYPYLSTDGGDTWTDVTGVPALQYWMDCSISGDGNTIVVSPGQLLSGTIYISKDRGITWREQVEAGNRNWQSSTVNQNGTKVLAGGTSSLIWIGTL